MRGSGPHPLGYVSLTAILLVAAVLIQRSHPLVVLASDRPEGMPVFAVGELAPGQSTASVQTLSDHGLLPLTFSLEVDAPGGGAPTQAFHLSIRRSDDGRVAYEGPLPMDSGPIGQLNPGQSTRLELTLSLPMAHGTQHLPLGFKLTWRGQAGVAGSWLVPVFELSVVLAAVVIVGRWYLESRGRPSKVAKGSGSP